MPEGWSGFSYIVTNLARFVRPDEVTFSGVNSTPPMLACLLAKRAYDFDFVYLNVAGGVQPRPSKIPLSSSDPVLAEGSTAIFANEDFYDLCTRGGMDLCFLGAAQVDGLGRTNVSVIGDWHRPKVRLPGGGGGAVMLPTARRAVTWRTEHSTRVLVDRLDFVTAAGGLHGGGDPNRGLRAARGPAGLAVLASRGDARRCPPADRVRARRGRGGPYGAAHRARGRRAARSRPRRAVRARCQRLHPLASLRRD